MMIIIIIIIIIIRYIPIINDKRISLLTYILLK